MKYKGMKNKNKLPEHLKETDFVSSWVDKLVGSDSRAGDKKYYRGNPVHFNCIYIPTPPHDKDLKDYLHFDYRFRTTEEYHQTRKDNTSQHNVVYRDLINNEKTMKQKKFYHTFEINNAEGNLEREVTLCILTMEKDWSFGTWNQLDNTVNIGYSVRVSDDKDMPGLSKKIALGRAEKTPINGGRLDSKYLFDNGVLKGIAYYWENEFRRDLGKYVKGVK